MGASEEAELSGRTRTRQNEIGVERARNDRPEIALSSDPELATRPPP